MCLFSNPRKNKAKWASVVMPSSDQSDIPVSVLEKATDLYIQQHCRILYESIKLCLTSKNPDIRKSRYKLACEQYGALIRVRKYADQKQRLVVNKAIDDFLKADDLYHHPNRVRSSEKIQTEKRKHDEKAYCPVDSRPVAGGAVLLLRRQQRKSDGQGH